MTCLDAYVQANIILPADIQALHFLGAVDGSFHHWTTMKRERMRSHPLIPLSLPILMKELIDESRHLHSEPTSSLHIQAPTKLVKNHRVVKCVDAIISQATVRNNVSTSMSIFGQTDGNHFLHLSNGFRIGCNLNLLYMQRNMSLVNHLNWSQLTFFH